jgi:hypothetical protein
MLNYEVVKQCQAMLSNFLRNPGKFIVSGEQIGASASSSKLNAFKKASKDGISPVR